MAMETSGCRFMRERVARVAFWITAAGLVLSGIDSHGGQAAPPRDSRVSRGVVRIKQFEFLPPTIVIGPGETVRWMNEDVAIHQVTTGTVEGAQPRPGGRVSSRRFVRGEDVTATFAVAGTYPYYCDVHPFMRGTIVVR